MSIAQEVGVHKGVGFEGLEQELAEFVERSVKEGVTAEVFERATWKRMLTIGFQTMQQFFQKQGSGDLGESVPLAEGRVLNRLPETHSREYQTVFGAFELERTVYGTREGQEIELVPLDARLALPESKFSYLLQDWDQMEATEEPYAKVSAFLEKILGFRQHVDSLERMSRKMAQEVEAFREARSIPPSKEEGEIFVESGDGKGVPIRRPADAPRIHDHQKRKGPKKDRKKMATVGAAYTIDCYVRTPEEVVDALFRQPGEQRCSRERPSPCHKQVWASLTHESDDEDAARDGLVTIMSWLAEQQQHRNPGSLKPTVCVMDGQPSLWEALRLVQPEVSVVEVLDLLHVTPRLWQAAHLFFPAQSDEAEAFVRERTLRILRGEVSYVVGGLKQMATKRGLGGKKLKDLGTICGYFESNRERMRYDEYLAAGYPIASGVIEGACRHYVKDRMERAGMSWIKPGAQAMLDLRATYLNGDWDDFQTFRNDREIIRLYPHREVLETVAWPMAA